MLSIFGRSQGAKRRLDGVRGPHLPTKPRCYGPAWRHSEGRKLAQPWWEERVPPLSRRELFGASWKGDGPRPLKGVATQSQPLSGMLLRPSTNICPKDLTRDMRGFFYSLLAAASRVPIGPQLGCWGATEQKARLSRGPHACQARFRRNPLENPLHPHSDRMKCGKHGPFLAARTMNPSVNFPKSKLNGSVQLLVRPQNLNYEARTFSWWGQRIRSRPTNRYATQF